MCGRYNDADVEIYGFDRISRPFARRDNYVVRNPSTVLSSRVFYRRFGRLRTKNKKNRNKILDKNRVRKAQSVVRQRSTSRELCLRSTKRVPTNFCAAIRFKRTPEWRQKYCPSSYRNTFVGCWSRDAFTGTIGDVIYHSPQRGYCGFYEDHYFFFSVINRKGRNVASIFTKVQ